VCQSTAVPSVPYMCYIYMYVQRERESERAKILRNPFEYSIIKFIWHYLECNSAFALLVQTDRCCQIHTPIGYRKTSSVPSGCESKVKGWKSKKSSQVKFKSHERNSKFPVSYLSYLTMLIHLQVYSSLIYRPRNSNPLISCH
jgi:hypothetical protein